MAQFVKAILKTSSSSQLFVPGQKVEISDKRQVSELVKWFPQLGRKENGPAGSWTAEASIELYPESGQRILIDFNKGAYIATGQRKQYDLQPGFLDYFKRLLKSKQNDWCTDRRKKKVALLS